MLTLSQKQQKAVEAVNDPIVDTLVLFGTVGTGKTDVAAHIVISICYKFEKTYWPVFRKDLSTAKKTVLLSYLEMLDKMGLVEGEDYIYNKNETYLKFTKTKSVIQFWQADESKDRQGRKIKGINATGNHCDEVDELNHTMYLQATSRKGRRNQFGQPSISILTLNPTDSEHLVELYEKYRAGTLPKNIRCIEFDINDSWQKQQDIDALYTNPRWWVERYIRNNWSYKDEESTIFKSAIFAKAKTETITPGKKTMGYDVADEGKDRAGGAEWENLTLYDITITKTAEEKVKPEDQTEWLMKRSDEREIGYENIAVDGVGNGAAVLATGRMKGAEFAVFKAGFSADPFLTFGEKALTKAEAEKQSEYVSFNNIRSQLAYLLAMGMEQGRVKIFIDTPYLKDFISEAQQHNNTVTDKVFILESKDSIKARTGKSPDIFDMVLMGFWLQLKKEYKVSWSDWKVK